MSTKTPMDPARHGDIAATEMPRYRSHKIVWALEIKAVDGHRLSFVEPGYADIDAPAEMFARYTPVPGDRYLVYPGNYKSFSPKAAFEAGYVREPPT